MKKVGLGLIGLGYIGKTHLRNCLKLKSSELVGASDISRRALNFARKSGVKNTFEDYHLLLKDNRIDAVVISLPTHLHRSCALDAAEAGKDIFLEKPLARNVEEGKEIVLTAEKHGCKLMVGYPLRFVHAFRDLKNKISSGELGDVQTAYASMVSLGPFFDRAESHAPHPVPSWWFSKELVGGGSLIDQGCHLINLLRWYFGEVKEVNCQFGYRFNLDVEDHSICTLGFESGQTAVINVGWYAKKNQIKVELLGSFDHVIACYGSGNRIISVIQLLAGITPKFNIPYLQELEHFVHSVKRDLEPQPSGTDAVGDMEVISRAYERISIT